MTESAGATIDDPTSDERWQAGLDYAMEQFCHVLRVDPKDVTWDAATEELEGDVRAVIGNILRAKYGEDFDPKTDLLQIMEEECWTLRCIDLPTGGGDSDIGWEAVQHHMAKPHDRVVGFGKTPKEALQAALTASKASGEA